MLLDKDHNTYGSVIPETGGLTISGDASPEIYANFEYKIPENADGSLTTINVVNGSTVTEVTITIVAGLYDWCITNPSPGDRVWIASENGNVGGRQNDFTFEAGKHYTFTVSLDNNSGNDCTNMTVEDDATLTPGSVTDIPNITSTSYTLSGLTASTDYTVSVQSVKGDKTSEWSSIYFTTLGEGEMALYVEGYGDSDGGYVLLASPIGTVNPENVTNMLTNTYDLYRFNQIAEMEWENYKQVGDHYHFDLEPGKGYLYANSQDVVLTFTGEVYSGNGEVTLSKTEGVTWSGWNLIGNPFGIAATLDKPSFKMNDAGNGFEAQTEGSTVNVMEGVFVQATEDNQTATFTTQTRGSKYTPIAQANIMVIGNNGTVIDNAIVRFDNGQTLEKFSFREGNTKISIPKDGHDYAIANSDSQSEMPLNFKAEANGTYTLIIRPEGVVMSYLHLIDNMTGDDIDLLATPNYTFNAKTTDYVSRFKLVFVCGEANDDDETFAFVSNGNIIVNGKGTLQVIDMTGRVIVSRSGHIQCVPTSGMPAGVYVLRLINGDDVKVQKIVVR